MIYLVMDHHQKQLSSFSSFNPFGNSSCTYYPSITHNHTLNKGRTILKFINRWGIIINMRVRTKRDQYAFKLLNPNTTTYKLYKKIRTSNRKSSKGSITSNIDSSISSFYSSSYILEYTIEETNFIHNQKTTRE